MLKWKTNKASGAKTAIGKKYTYGYTTIGVFGVGTPYLPDMHIGIRVKTFKFAKQIAELIEK